MSRNPPTRFGVHNLLFLCSIQNFVTRCPSKIPSPKSKIPKIQNPKSPNSKIQTLHKKICYIMFQKSKIQNPQNPKSPKSKIPTIQNPKSPKSKIPQIQNPQSKILRQNLKFGALGASRKELLHNDPKSKIQNPQNPAKKVWILDFGDFGFWDFGGFGFWILGILDFGDFGFSIWRRCLEVRGSNPPWSAFGGHFKTNCIE